MLEGNFAQLPKALARYAVSIAALWVATAITLAIVHYGLPRQIIGYTFLLVIIGSAWWGGYGPGLLTTFATLLLGPYAVQANYTIRHPSLVNLPQILLISVLISRMAATRTKLRESNERLDEGVRQRTAELHRANITLLEREALLISQAEELAHSNADLEQFAYVASHDLQEPLRVIAIFTELIYQRSGARFDDDSVRFMHTVLEGVQRMERLVQDLLTYSRTRHEELAAPVEVDSAYALQVAIQNLEPVIRATGAAIESNDLPKLIGDRSQLTQLFQNLVGNALKYSDCKTPCVKVTAALSDHEWTFSVADNGIGIHPDYHEMIFSPFKRLHGQQYPGSGVGLAICRRIVDRLGGRIWVESEPKKGSIFSFSIPVIEPRKPLVQDSA